MFAYFNFTREALEENIAHLEYALKNEHTAWLKAHQINAIEIKFQCQDEVRRIANDLIVFKQILEVINK